MMTNNMCVQSCFVRKCSVGNWVSVAHGLSHNYELQSVSTIACIMN